jgi:hypothetical protein
MLDTPDPHVFVLVRPSLSGPGFSFTPFVAVASSPQAVRARDILLDQERVSTISDAYRALLLDLLRLVCVRDSHINALGEIGGSRSDKMLLGWDEEKDCATYEVRFHPSSGYAVPVGLFGGEDWGTLCSLIRQLGAGDHAAGRTALIERLQRDTYAEAAAAGRTVHRLMLLGAWKLRSAVAARLGLGPDDVTRFDQEMAAAWSEDAAPPSFVDEITDDALDTARVFLNRLGLGHGDLDETVRRLRYRKAAAEAWPEVVAIASDDYPDEALVDEATLKGPEFPAQLKIVFEAAGRQDLAAWADRTVARPEGRAALADILRYIARQAKERGRE